MERTKKISKIKNSHKIKEKKQELNFLTNIPYSLRYYEILEKR